MIEALRNRARLERTGRAIGRTRLSRKRRFLIRRIGRPGLDRLSFDLAAGSGRRFVATTDENKAERDGSPHAFNARILRA